jgi:uncharacterized protein with ParB-like and HNH nuclease domain
MIEEKTMISVKNLLSYANLKIPEYQRPYKWTVKNVNQLIDDILLMSHAKKSAYRLGTVVLHKNEKNELNIVDGQQRLITLTLIILAITKNNDRFKELKELADYKPTLMNLEFKSDISKNNIQTNYKEIERRIRDLDDENAISFLFFNCEFVMITLFDKDSDKALSEAFQFFDSQNSRGKELEPHDLLKAFHLREMANVSESEELNIVSSWENIETKELSKLFSDYLYKIRNWSNGKSALYFTKNDIDVFKGINVNDTRKYPFAELLRIVDFYIDDYNADNHRHLDGNKINYPFQIDQTIINGKRFFEMIAYYKTLVDYVKNDEFKDVLEKYESQDQGKETVLGIIHSENMSQKRAKNTRNLFDCALIYFIDKYGKTNIKKAIKNIFIWAYSLRLQMIKPQDVTFNRYALGKDINNIYSNIRNVFVMIRSSIADTDIINMKLDKVRPEVKANVGNIVPMFKAMEYYDGK